MRVILFCASILLPSLCSANSDVIGPTLEWLQDFDLQRIEFSVDKSSIKFSGCKQTEYTAVLNQPLFDNTVLEMGVGYAKGQHSWGVFNQRISVKQFSFVPRYQLKHDLSVGLGVVIQSSTKFRNSQGLQFDLPNNSQWLLNARMPGVKNNHYWELTVASQTWAGNQKQNTLFEKEQTNNKVGLQYSGYF